jgi:hypothetical protein
MASQYSVVQYVPDPIADERINIGVVVIGDSGPRVQFLSNWDRVKRFGKADIGYLREFASKLAAEIKHAGEELTLKDPGSVEKRLEKMVSGWMNSIQFTPLRGSLKSSADLLEEARLTFLVDQVRERQGYRDRGQAANATRKALRFALEKRFSDRSDDFLRANEPIDGRFVQHVFDAVVANGAPYLAAHALSFEIPEPKQLVRVVDAIAFQAEDVKGLSPDLPIGIVVYPPKEKAPNYGLALAVLARAQTIFGGLDIPLLAPTAVEIWAEPTVNRLANARSNTPTEPQLSIAGR